MIHSFLLIGQSNMAGRGKLDEAPKLDNTNMLVLKNGRWQPLYRPINNDRDTAGYNLAETFIQDYLKQHEGVKVGLIPCADGGTSLGRWREGGLLFDNAVYQARLASRTSTIAGVLWHQGEGDCSKTRYPVYKEKLEAMIEALRKELDLYDVPFIVGGLGDFLAECKLDPDFVNFPYVNEALQSVANKEKRIGFASAEGLGSLPDKLHFSTEALIELGHRYYEAFSKLENKQKVFEEKPDVDSAYRTEFEHL